MKDLKDTTIEELLTYFNNLLLKEAGIMDNN